MCHRLLRSSTLHQETEGQKIVCPICLRCLCRCAHKFRTQAHEQQRNSDEPFQERRNGLKHPQLAGTFSKRLASHRHPQVILGMHYEWSPEDLECLRIIFQEYREMHAPLLPENFFDRLRQDPDIQVACDYRSAMGIKLSEDVVGVYLGVMERRV